MIKVKEVYKALSGKTISHKTQASNVDNKKRVSTDLSHFSFLKKITLNELGLQLNMNPMTIVKENGLKYRVQSEYFIFLN